MKIGIIKYKLRKNHIVNDNLKINSFSKGRKKPLIYIQPESSNFNYKHRNNDFKIRNFTANNNHILHRDNYKNNQKKFYRFNTENDNRAINILMGNE